MENSPMQNDAMKKPDDMKKSMIDPLNETLKGAGETPADGGESADVREFGQEVDPENGREDGQGIRSPGNPTEEKYRPPTQPESSGH